MSEPIEAPPLARTRSQEVRTLARQIADQLGEQWGAPRRQIERIIWAIGPERIVALVAEALAVQAAGGEQTLNGQRPRTPGGIFFRLVRQLGPENETIRRMFMAHPPKRYNEGEPTVAPASPVALATWADRLDALDELLADGGGSRTMKITLTGRPGTIVDKGTYIITTMPAQKVPALPKGLPAIPEDAQPPQTLVLIAKKQWARVEAALADPADILILEGFGMYEPSVKGLTVLATTVTTSGLQRAKRQGEASALP